MLYRALVQISYEPTGKKTAWKYWEKGQTIDTKSLPTSMPFKHLLESGDIEEIPVPASPEIP